MRPVTTKSDGLSGRSVGNKDKHHKPGSKWDLTAVISSLKLEMGEYEGKVPCPFFHVRGQCNNEASKCQWYH